MKTDTLLLDWMTITGRFNSDKNLQAQIFNELVKRYSGTYRHYHNLVHIHEMLDDVKEYFEGKIPYEIFFAVWFHDAVYNPLLSNNEAKSAELASEQLGKLYVPDEVIKNVQSLILKTANHLEAVANDENSKIFLDADLKILGMEEQRFINYTEAIRKEFSLFPNFLFKKGRRKFIEKTIATPRIYRTEKFFQQFEQQARKNLLTELNQLL